MTTRIDELKGILAGWKLPGELRSTFDQLCAAYEAKIAEQNAVMHTQAEEVCSEIEASTKVVIQLRADLRAALKPFAELADQYERAHKTRTRHAMDEGHKPPPPLSDSHRVSISLGDCRRAASILASHKENADG